MIGLRYRDVLPSVVVDELESMIAQIRAWALEEHDESGRHIVEDRDLAFTPVGSTMGWLTNTAPTGWLILQGQQVNRVTYKGLFDLWGTTFGVGDSSTTFNVPDMRGRFFLGKAASGTGSTLGATGGTIDHSHSVTGNTGATAPAISGSTAAEASHTHTGPSHTHPITGSTASESSHTHGFSGTTSDSIGGDLQGNGGNAADTSPHNHTFSGTTGAGSSHAHGVGTLATSAEGTGNTGAGTSHSHGVGTLAVDSHVHPLSGITTGTANPPFLAGNWIVFTGVRAT